MPNIRLTGAAVKPVKRHKHINTHTDELQLSIYIKLQSVCMSVCLSVCLYVNFKFIEMLTHLKSLVLGIEPFETFVVVGGGWSKVILV